MISKSWSSFSRREFVIRAGMALTAAGCSLSEPVLRADPLNMPMGVQGYDARFLLAKEADWKSGWKTVKSLGFQAVDLVMGFPPYMDQMSGKAIRQTLDSVGILCENCQFPFAQLHDSFDEKMQFSHDLGLKYIISAPAFGRTKTIDDWKWQSDQLNALGQKINQAGFQLGYHNHNIEFMPIDGILPYDALMEHTEPNLVKFQIDVGNLTFAGADPYAYLAKYSNRYFSLHAKDYKPGLDSVAVGQGILNWKRIFALARKAPIKNYFVEVGSYGAGGLPGAPKAVKPPSPEAEASELIEQLRQSYVYLHSMKA